MANQSFFAKISICFECNAKYHIYINVVYAFCCKCLLIYGANNFHKSGKRIHLLVYGPIIENSSGPTVYEKHERMCFTYLCEFELDCKFKFWSFVFSFSAGFFVISKNVVIRFIFPALAMASELIRILL